MLLYFVKSRNGKNFAVLLCFQVNTFILLYFLIFQEGGHSPPVHTRDKLIIVSAIDISLYWQIFSNQLLDQSICVLDLQQMHTIGGQSQGLLIIKFLGGRLVAKKPYFMNTMRLSFVIRILIRSHNGTSLLHTEHDGATLQ